MIYLKLYFWIPLVILFFLDRKDIQVEENFIFKKYIPTYKQYCFSMISIFTVAISFNINYQIFCIPVWWAAVFLIILFIWLIVYPKIYNLKTLNSIGGGALFFVSIYILYFGSYEYLMYAIGNAIIFLPLYIIYYRINKNKTKKRFGFLCLYGNTILFPFISIYMVLANIKSLKQFLIGSSIPMLIIAFNIFLLTRYQKFEQYIFDRNQTELLKVKSNIIDNYILELVLGARWKYHTNICLYDGFRPPFHDPNLIIMNLISKIHPSDVSVVSSIFLDPIKNTDIKELFYSKIYPNNPTHFNCKCATNERLEL